MGGFYRSLFQSYIFMDKTKSIWKSKLVWLGLTMLFVGLSTFLGGFLRVNVTPDQYTVIEQAFPALLEELKRTTSSGNIFGAITSIGGFLTVIWRVWFTDTRVVLFTPPKN